MSNVFAYLHTTCYEIQDDLLTIPVNLPNQEVLFFNINRVLP